MAMWVVVLDVGCIEMVAKVVDLESLRRSNHDGM